MSLASPATQLLTLDDRATIVADPEPPALYTPGEASLPPLSVPIVGCGDAATLKDAEKLAALHACIQLGARGLFTESNLPTRTKGMKTPLHAASLGGGQGGGNGQFATYASGGASTGNDGKTIGLSAGQRIGLEEARAFMDYYCQRFNFGKPDLRYATASGGRGRQSNSSWCATLLVDGRRIGMGESKSKKDAMNRAYLDTAQYLESCDKDLWGSWSEKKTASMVMKGAMPAHVVFEVDAKTDEELRETVWETKESSLYKRAQAMIEREKEKVTKERERQRLLRLDGGRDEVATAGDRGTSGAAARRADLRAPLIARKSEELQARLRDYQTNPRVEKLRNQRLSLPVASHATSVLAKIANSSVVVVLAATGSGKTTQVPQLILDDWILRGDGAKCNIVCTQPRRIAAISVAERVAAERGEKVGDSVGYQVRFESKPPKPDGSILFCTTGLFLRRLQSDLANSGNEGFLDGVTHVAVDEVHERDVDTDLLLFVLRRLLHERRKAGKAEIRVILM